MIRSVSDTKKFIPMEHYESREVDDAGPEGKAKQRSNLTKPQGDPKVRVLR